MKKLLIVLASIIVIFLAAAFIVPIVFEDDIKASIDEALEESVNADIVWDTEDFSLSLFTNFPNVTAQLNNFGIFNRAPFEGKILFAVEELEVEVDLFSLMGDQIKINGIFLNHPEIFIRVLEDGTANYDIAKETKASEEAPADTSAASFNIGIDHWQVDNGHIIYDDATIPYYMELKGLQHSGSGDFTQDVFDLNTSTLADSVFVTFDGIEYVSGKRLNAEVLMSISEEYSRYTFKENQVKVNDFSMGFEGFLALNDDGSMDMDINYSTKENTFKSLLSLVPGIYTDDFNNIETAGNLSFSGAVKGKYDSLNMPAFNLALKVNDAMFKYPDLPTAINNIEMDLLVDNPDGVVENTVVDLKQFHMDFGNNPVDASLLVKNLSNYDMVADISASLNLQELSQMFPLEGMTLKGLYSVDLKASGIYDSVQNKFPSIDATMGLKNGYVKTNEFPYTLQDLHFDAKITDPTGLMKDFKAVVTDFSMTMDEEPFKANLTFSNLINYTWDLTAQGGIDLEKITKVFPLEGMELKGNIDADLSTKGTMADLDAERYASMPTSGSITLTGFSYVDKELPYDVTISSTKASFNPKEMRIESYEGTIGESDIKINGSVNNYIGYIFSDNEVLKGQMNFSSNLLNLNEFMTEEEESSTPDDSEDSEMGVVQVPENIDFVLKSSIQTVKMMDLEIKNVSGDIIVRNGIANLSNLTFNLLDGQFAVNGSYNANDINKPIYDFKLNIDNISIKRAAENFQIIGQYAPVAKVVSGNFSTDFSLNGLLDQSMMPKLESITGSGLIEIAKATLDGRDSKLVSGLSSVTKLSGADKVTMDDVTMQTSIDNGKLTVEPFDVEFGNYKTTIQGTTALDGRISYGIKMDVPAGKLGSQFNSFVSSYSGADNSGSSTIPINIVLGGSVTDPKPQLQLSDQKSQVKSAVKNKVKEEVKDAAKDAASDLLDDKAKDVVGGLLGGSKKDTVKSDSTKKDAKESVEEKAKEKLRNLFKKKGDGK